MSKLSRSSFARLISSISSITQYDFTDYQIKDIDEIVTFEDAPVQEVAPPVAPKASESSVNDLLSAVKAGKKIEAIRAYRVLTGSGVKESKDAVEAHWPVQTEYKTAVQLQNDMVAKINQQQDKSHDSLEYEDFILTDFHHDDLNTIKNFIHSFTVYR